MNAILSFYDCSARNTQTLPAVIQMSQWVKMLVPQWGIKPWSLTIQVSIMTTRPPRYHYIHPSKAKACPHPFKHTSSLEFRLVTKCHNGLKR